MRIFAFFAQPVKHLTPLGMLVAINAFQIWLKGTMLTAFEIPDHFAVYEPKLNSWTFTRNPETHTFYGWTFSHSKGLQQSLITSSHLLIVAAVIPHLTPL